jgi:Cu(I)/Ag(I) efflux system membrane fusion protein
VAVLLLRGFSDQKIKKMKPVYSILATLIIGIGLGLFISRWWGGEESLSAAERLQAMQSFSNCSTDGTSVAYTCSMHPSLERGEAGQCPACGMKMIEKRLLPQHRPELVHLSKGEATLAHVQTQRVRPVSRVQRQIHLSGKLAAQENRIKEQVAGLPGRIEAFYVEATGTYVQKGQPIASIYSKDLISSVEILTQGNSSASIMRAARNNLKSWNLDISVLREFDFKSGDYRKPITIHADFGGYVLDRKVKAGSYTANAHMGVPTTLYTIADLSELWAVFEVYEDDLAWVEKGQRVQFEVAAYPGRSFAGHVSFVSPVVDPISRTVEIRVDVPNPDGLLKPDLLAEATLSAKVATSKTGIAVPKSAVLWTGPRSLVYVRDTSYQQPIYHPRTLTLGPALGDYYLVERGLVTGEQVVVNGAFALDAAAQLDGKKSMMNRPAPHPDIVAGQVYAGSAGENPHSER